MQIFQYNSKQCFFIDYFFVQNHEPKYIYWPEMVKLFFMSSDCTHVHWMTYCEGATCHSLTPLFVQFVTAGYAVWAPFKFSCKSISFPWAKHHFVLIFSCENLTNIGQISLLEMLLNHWIFWIKNESVCDAGGKNNVAGACTCSSKKMFHWTSSSVSSRQEGLITG